MAHVPPEQLEHVPDSAARKRSRQQKQHQPNRWFWFLLAAPGMIWLLVLFVVPFYAVLAIGEGKLDRQTESPVAVYNPLTWSSANLSNVWHDLFGSGAFAGAIAWRTIWYVVVASLLSLVIAYPAAYFVARFAGRRKGFFLVLLIAPFWISYMMRMLAWIDLLQTDGYVNKVLSFVGLGSPDWLGGHSYTVILGLVYGYIPYLILVLYAGLDRIDPSLIEAGRDLGLGRLRTFLRVTLPLSRQPILTGMLITVLPMLGDYYTNQLLSGARDTSMIGNLIQGQLSQPSGGPGRDPLADRAARADRADDLLRGPDQPGLAGGVMSSTAVREPVSASAAESAPRPRLFRNPWRHPWFLEGFTWLYLIWSLAPIAIAVLFSFNKGKSQASYQGLSWRWYWGDKVNSIWHNPQLHSAMFETLKLSAYTTLIAVPIGVAFALGINRWRGVLPSSFNFIMILSFVVPELIFGVALFFVFTKMPGLRAVGLGNWAEVLGLVTWNVSWPAIIVQARLVTIGKQYEEASADLGCTQFQTMRRVMLPLLTPAIFASAILVFSGVIDDFVIVDLLSSNAGNTPMSVIIYSTQHGGNGGPALNALATVMLLLSFVVAGLGYVGYRIMTRGQRVDGQQALTAIAGAE